MKRVLTATLLAMLATVGVGAVAATPANAAYVTGCTYTNSQPTLSRGSSGTAVKQLQCELNRSLYYTKVTVDGSFGPATQSAVRTFQSCAGIGVDGVVGPVTWGQLNYWAGSTGWLYC